MIRLAIALVRANCRRDPRLTVRELVGMVGVTDRTLRSYFRAELGMTPSRYLRTARLCAAHRALVEAEGGTATVTRIAVEHGFHELGRFSVQYRAAFGETPSSTLRRVETGTPARIS